MMRHTSCSVILFLMKKTNHIFPKMQVSQTPYLYNKVFLIWASKYPTLHTDGHKKVNSMAPKSDRNFCTRTPIRPIVESHLSLHLFQANTFTGTHFGSTQEPFYPYPSAPVVVINPFLIFNLHRVFHILQEVDYSKKKKTHSRPIHHNSSSGHIPCHLKWHGI